MVGSAIANFVVACVHLLASAVSGMVRFVIALLGPGLAALLVASVAALWWFGWI